MRDVHGVVEVEGDYVRMPKAHWMEYASRANALAARAATLEAALRAIVDYEWHPGEPMEGVKPIARAALAAATPVADDYADRLVLQALIRLLEDEAYIDWGITLHGMTPRLLIDGWITTTDDENDALNRVGLLGPLRRAAGVPSDAYPPAEKEGT